VRITIHGNLEADDVLSVAHELASILVERGATVVFDKAYSHVCHATTASFGHLEQSFDGASYAISIGGDGTFLRVARLAAPERVPILGINMGVIGFLTELSRGEVGKTARLFSGDYTIEQRMMLTYSVLRDGHSVDSGTALNDVAVHKELTSQLVEFTLQESDSFVTRWRSDGVLIATPTGSTAYALSCGGAIIDPSADCIEAVPVSPHTLTARPIIFKGNAHLVVVPKLSNQHTTHVFCDGRPSVQLMVGDVLEIKKAQITTDIIRMGSEGFYHAVRSKLHDR